MHSKYLLSKIKNNIHKLIQLNIEYLFQKSFKYMKMLFVKYFLKLIFLNYIFYIKHSQ